MTDTKQSDTPRKTPTLTELRGLVCLPYDNQTHINNLETAYLQLERELNEANERATRAELMFAEAIDKLATLKPLMDATIHYGRLWNSTPTSHDVNGALEQALQDLFNAARAYAESVK